ncbi:transport and Golgi organization protein 1 homolog isoform X2 [Antennarius striatus]|uniref:transport and Golgi organization protein 1 homolog isoform X2 n=1 Tax=Antennarius striatus TaxID=241820 RepID=UPI0035B1332F
MAAKHFYRQGFLLLLFNFICTAALEKRFSDFKRCADEECSMLLCRGKALKDFSGPDCRFLSVKKSETIYVYYKLSGRRGDIWAGSVGSNFGYFPKYLLAVNHNYTEKEHEIPTEETDFVCFDTGYDKFKNYDIDSLLGSSLEANDGDNKAASDQIQTAEDPQTETQPPADEEGGDEEETEGDEDTEDFDVVPDDPSASLPEIDPEVESETSETEAVPEETQRENEDSDLQKITLERSETKDASVTSESVDKVDDVSGGESVSFLKELQIPELKTTLGTTFDAVVSDDLVTTNFTPFEEEEDEYEESPPDEDPEVKAGTPFLSYSEESVNAPSSDDLKLSQSPSTHQDKPETGEDKNVWSSLGDAVFSVVTGGEVTEQDLSSEEGEDDDDEEEEATSKTPQSFEETKNDVEDPISPEENSAELHLQDPSSRSEPTESTDPNSDTEKLSFADDDDGDDDDEDDDDDDDDESDGEVVRPEEGWEERFKPTETSPSSADPAPQDDPAAVSDDAAEKPTETKEADVFRDSGSDARNAAAQEQREDSADELRDKNAGTDQELLSPEPEIHQDRSTEETRSEDSDADKKEKSVDASPTNQMNDGLMLDVSTEEPEILEEVLSVESQEEEDKETEREEGHQELLADENALFFSESDKVEPVEALPETTTPTGATPEPEYSDSVLRLTLLRDRFTEENMERIQKLLGLKNLFKLEAMFSDLDAELEATRRLQTGATYEIETALEGILETSENAILDEIEKMLDSQGKKRSYDQDVDTSALDEETEILDDFQELAFSLRQKYSTASDTTPLAVEKESYVQQDKKELNVKDEAPHILEDSIEVDNNMTATGHVESPAQTVEELVVLDEVNTSPHVSIEQDGGRYNNNQDNQPSFSESEEIPQIPHTTLQNPLDTGLPVEVEHSPSDSLESMEPVSEIHEEEAGLFSTGIVYMSCILSLMKNKTAEWTIVMISLLPEEWKPGETLYGCPWEAAVVTALVGVVSLALFFWRTVLAVKKREYLVDEKRLTEQIQTLKKEKNNALERMAKLEKQSEQLKENQKQSKEKVTSSRKIIQDLESKVSEAQKLNDELIEDKNKYVKELEEQRKNSLQNETRIDKLEKSNEKLQLSRKKIQEAFAKTTVLLDEAKIREDARNVQHKCLEKDLTALKDESKTLKATIKDWEEKHKELNEQIKVYQKSQKELEDSVVLKDHNVEVLSELLADIDACDSQKGDAKVLANGEVARDKRTAIKNRLKQMMDVSRVQTTLSVVEEERDRFMSKLLNEEKVRKSLEEQHQELEHAIATIKNEKSHVENQFKVLQQKNEIMVEMYQQKENALQQRLTKEELERRSKENMLSEVGGKAMEAEEQVKVLRQRINEMEEQMKKTEEVYKEQIKEQENKTHSNWVNARNAERALSQEKLESSKFREKLAVLTSQLNERRAPLFIPNSGHPAGPRQGDSYGPSPVSGGAPSPPLMIEGPRRPPSAPVGRRIDPYDMTGPRSSSPTNVDVSTQEVDPQIKAESGAEVSSESPEPGPASFLVSPIRDSPGPMVPGPPPGVGPHDQLPPPGRLPPHGSFRPPRPGMYNLPHGPAPFPANGQPVLPPPAPIGEFGPRPANGHAFLPRPGPGHDPRGPPPPQFRPLPPHPYGPMPPPLGVRGPMGPRPPLPPDMRYPGPRDHSGLPLNLPPGVPPHPAHDAYGQAPPNALQNSTGETAGLGRGLHGKQGAPQDSVRPAMAKP